MMNENDQQPMAAQRPRGTSSSGGRRLVMSKSRSLRQLLTAAEDDTSKSTNQEVAQQQQQPHKRLLLHKSKSLRQLGVAAANDEISSSSSKNQPSLPSSLTRRSEPVPRRKLMSKSKSLRQLVVVDESDENVASPAQETTKPSGASANPRSFMARSVSLRRLYGSPSKGLVISSSSDHHPDHDPQLRTVAVSNDSMGTDSECSLGTPGTSSPWGRTIFRRRGSSSSSSLQSSGHCALPRKQVHFAGDHVNDNSPLETVVAESSSVPPPLTDEDIKTLFWSRKELDKTASQCRRMAEEVSWKKDTHARTCLNFLYQSCSSPSSTTPAKTAVLADKTGLTMDSALEYYFSCKVILGAATGDDHQRRHETSLRGLERHVLPRIADRRMAFIQTVLSLQTSLRQQDAEHDKSGNGSRGSKEERTPEARLAKASAAASLPARKFARLLGKADKAVALKLLQEESLPSSRGS